MDAVKTCGNAGSQPKSNLSTRSRIAPVSSSAPINDPKASEIQHSKRKTKYRVIRARSKPGVWETGSGETRFGFFPAATAELPRRKGRLRVRARLSWELCGCKERTLEVHGEGKRLGRGGHSAVAEGIVGRERDGLSEQMEGNQSKKQTWDKFYGRSLNFGQGSVRSPNFNLYQISHLILISLHPAVTQTFLIPYC